MLQSLIRLVEELEDEIDIINLEVEERMRPFQAMLALLEEIPGIGLRTAERILTET